MSRDDFVFWGFMALAACLLWMRVRIALTERRERADAAWAAHIDSIIRDEETVVRPLTDAPGFDRITNLIAANEAARADWDEPAKWGDPA